MSVGSVPQEGHRPATGPAADDPACFAERIRWQSLLFAPRLERRQLLRLRAPWPLARRRVRIHRNHAVELTLSVARPFLEFAGLAVEWELGDYDDSLAFTASGPADAEVVWLDYARLAERLTATEIADWLIERLTVLRSRAGGPILLLDWDGGRPQAAAFSERVRASASGQDIHLAERGELFDQLGERYFDAPREAITGTRMSAEGAAATARLLGSRWLPALLAPRARAVVVDLDNTLFDGVLGEDGADSLVLTDDHHRLHQELLALHDRGIFLGLLSRNHPDDVQALFRARRDLGLRWESFDARSLGWGDKSGGLREVADALRIDPSAIVFVDDNPGELLEAALRLPGLRLIHAGPGGSATLRALRHFPGLWVPERGEADRLRTADVRANARRERLLADTGDDLGAYFRALGVTLTVAHDHGDQLQRVAELSSKTNQFNLAFSRYRLSELQALAQSAAHHISTARLEDRLTDSGVVAMAVFRREEERLLVEELCISCRALGRRLEDLIVAQMLIGGRLEPGIQRVVFRFRDGPRNEPARRWLERLAGRQLAPAAEPVSVTVPLQRLLDAAATPDVRVVIAGDREDRR